MLMRVLVPKDDGFKLGYSIPFGNVILAMSAHSWGTGSTKSSHARAHMPLSLLLCRSFHL